MLPLGGGAVAAAMVPSTVHAAPAAFSGMDTVLPYGFAAVCGALAVMRIAPPASTRISDSRCPRRLSARAS